MREHNPGINPRGSKYPVSIAPMIDKSHRYFRQILRLLTKHTLLYTEMIAGAAIIHGDKPRLLDFSPEEKPLALQIGTGNPHEAKQAVHIAQDWDYDEINLNVGCPSDRVQSGAFGACLMADPKLVADILSAMVQATDKPVTVKHRIGIRSKNLGTVLEDFEDLMDFVHTVIPTGIHRCTVHARIAILEGLSPKENRDIPPLRYQDVYRLKGELAQKYPHLEIEINGGVKTYDQINAHLEQVDGVMIGRASYDDPYLLSEFDRRYYAPDAPIPSRREVILGAFDLLELWQQEGQNPRNLVWPILELFAGIPGTRTWKRLLSRPFPAHLPVRPFLEEALAQAPADWLDASLQSIR